jgi:hypothetical protein
MLGPPKYGWSTLKVGDFAIDVSYLTDVAVDFLTALANYHPWAPTSVACDAECQGSFYVLLTKYHTFIVGYSWLPNDSEKYGLLEYDIPVEQVAMEIYNDVMGNIRDWVHWDIFENNKFRYRIEAIKVYIKLRILLRKVRKKFKLDKETNGKSN